MYQYRFIWKVLVSIGWLNIRKWVYVYTSVGVCVCVCTFWIVLSIESLKQIMSSKRNATQPTSQRWTLIHSDAAKAIGVLNFPKMLTCEKETATHTQHMSPVRVQTLTNMSNVHNIDSRRADTCSYCELLEYLCI